MPNEKRYQVESDFFGYWVIDTTIDEGEPCNVAGFVKRAQAERRAAQMNAHDAGEPCEIETCQECCPHDERDHGICLVCGDEEDAGVAIDRAQAAMEDR